MFLDPIRGGEGLRVGLAIHHDTLQSEEISYHISSTLGESEMATITKPQPTGLTSDQILHIARIDAERVYKDLSGYRSTLALQGDGWHVDYELINPDLNGGGPHYIIDPTMGAILSKRYEQ